MPCIPLISNGPPSIGIILKDEIFFTAHEHRALTGSFCLWYFSETKEQRKLMLKSLALTFFITTPAMAHLLPDLTTAASPLGDRSVEVLANGSKLLRFSNGVANIGHGPAELEGGDILEDGKQQVWQRIYNEDGSAYTRLAGTFTYHPEHEHTHFDEFAHYGLRKVIGRSGIGAVVAQSQKVSFCLYDDSVYNSRLPNYTPRRYYRTCNDKVQGISVGWADVYDKSLPGQHIDITRVPRGWYWLESTVDPYNRIEEANERNNTTRVKIFVQ